MDIKKLARLLAPIIVDGVLAVKQNSKHRLVEMLHELEFVTRSFTQLPDSIVIELQILDVDLLFRLLAGEANKFLLASRISHERATQRQTNNASWQAVEHYYAAYYSVHYLLRLTGLSVTNLDSRATNAIIRSNLATTPISQVPNGLYLMQFDDQTNILTLRKNTKRGPGGSHQDVWQLWEGLIDKLKNQATTDLVEYAAVSISLTEHKNFLTRSTAKYNPPEIRGEINYQFKGGSWIFEPKAQESIERIQRLISSHQPSLSIGSPTTDGLIASNKIIISLAKTIFVNAAERYPKSIGRSIANKYAAYVI